MPLDLSSPAGEAETLVRSYVSSVRFDNNDASRMSTLQLPLRRNSMKHCITKSVLIALTLWMSASLCLAGETQPQKLKQATAADQAPAKKSKAAPPKAAPVVDINSASKEELKKLPGIGDAEANKIIAGRPYLSKAHLQTHNIVSPGVYQGLQRLVVARQKDAKFAKDVKKK